MSEYKSGMVRTTDRFLIVHFTERVGTTHRHSTVKVPLESLVLSASVVQALDRATRRALIEHWSGVDFPTDDPLFE
jgi:hypothetical protein